MMKVYRAATELSSSVRRAISIGFFDGVHVGHVALLGELRATARVKGVEALVITFTEHPFKVLKPQQVPPLLVTFEEKMERLSELGVAECLALPFTPQLARQSAREFCEGTLKRLGCAALVVGENFALGANREGDLVRLRQLGEELGFEVVCLRAVTIDGRVISSSCVREAVKEGDVELATRLLGRPYSLRGRQAIGRGLGRQMGFPTINLRVHPEKLLPRWGVYAGLARFSNEKHPTVANIGVRPTVDGSQLEVEAHLLNFCGKVEAQEVEIELIHFLRPEQKFDSLAHLTEQIMRDVQAAKQRLSSLS